ncbi:MAG: polysulfide reductase NrfD [Zoogloeaceae bacterium]|nr:polysulfide reductase NrfD [Zoogloeaceae bacterium]
MQHNHARRTPLPAPPGYYGLPALKASHWKWMVALYIWLAGLAGAMQILAALALMTAPDMETAAVVTRPARYGALLAAAIGTVLLIADLLTPRRFLNMLRIFRGTSPMSFGSYLLVAFTGFTALSVALQFGADVALISPPPRWVELAVQLPAAAFGLLLVVYTAPLLSATSTPLWAHSPGLLAGSFAGFSMAAGASALSLWGQTSGGSPWDKAFGDVAFLSLGVAWAFLLGWTACLARARLMQPLLSGSAGALFVIGVLGVGLMLPTVLHLAQMAASGQLALATALAAMAELAGSLAWRGALLIGGQSSARRAADALRFAGSPDFMPAATGGASTTEQSPQGRAAYWIVAGLALGGAAAVTAAGMLLAPD